MDIIFSGSVKSIARFIHLDFTGLPPTKMSQTPEIPLMLTALTFGWALPQPQPLSYKPQQEGPSEASSAPTQALLPLCHGCQQSSHAALPVAGVHWKPIQPQPQPITTAASARHRSGYPGADTATAAASSLHPAPPASGLQGMTSAFFPSKTVFLHLKGSCFDAYWKWWKKWTAGNLSWNSNVNSNNTNKKKTSTFSQMRAPNDSSKKYMYLYGYNIQLCVGGCVWAIVQGRCYLSLDPWQV